MGSNDNGTFPEEQAREPHYPPLGQMASASALERAQEDWVKDVRLSRAYSVKVRGLRASAWQPSERRSFRERTLTLEDCQEKVATTEFPRSGLVLVNKCYAQHLLTKWVTCRWLKSARSFYSR